jgi:hypothetical protein
MQVGRTVSTIQGYVEGAVGLAMMADGGVKFVASVAASLGCTIVGGPVGGVACGAAATPIAIAGVSEMAGGLAVGGHGAGILWNNTNHPLQIKGNGGGGNLPPNPEKGYFGTNAQDTGKNADRLFANMKAANPSIDKPFGYPAHHIVPSKSDREFAIKARQILEEFGIDINNAGNGVIIPKNMNSQLNNKTYEAAVYQALQEAKDMGRTQSDVLELLQDIGDQILATGKYP